MNYDQKAGPARRSTLKKKLPYLITGLFLLAGLLVLFYPSISNWYNSRFQFEAVIGYDDSIEKANEKTIDEERQRAKDYNDKLTGYGITDPFIPGGGLVLPEGYESILNVTGGIMGTLQIPKINVNLPIYHGTSAEVLERGVGHMEMTAFPIGGENSHTVLTGHTALPNAVLFSDLDKLVEGDTFYIKVYNETLAYQVDQIEIVKPDNTDLLIPVKGKDYVSLVTCTPYAVNTHRLVVRGVRVPYEAAVEEEQAAEARKAAHIPFDLLIALIALGLVILVLVVTLIRRHQRNKRRLYRQARLNAYRKGNPYGNNKQKA